MDKIPQGLQKIVNSYPDYISEEDVGSLKEIPRVAKLNPKFLLLSFIIYGHLDKREEFPSDILDNDKKYSDKSLGSWINELFDSADRKNMYRLKVQLLSYITKLALHFSELQETVTVWREEGEEDEEDEEEQEYDPEEYASEEDDYD